jgi:L-ascorbate metabolism protein UlaG (beta-lactamase superfamily)
MIESLFNSKFNKKVRLVFFILIIAFPIHHNIYAQMYSFPEIRENLFRERAQTGDYLVRKNSIISIDDLILGTYPPLHPEAQWFYRKMLEKAIIEIKNEGVSSGATIWQIYNHGFIIRTPSVSFAVDLHDYFHLSEFYEFADLIDAYFVSHEHQDHYSPELVGILKSRGIPVVGPTAFSPASIKMAAGDSATISNLKVHAHYGLHADLDLRQFEIITPEGLKFLHTGDNQTTETLPVVSDVDVMMLNCWINESGSISHVEGVRIAIDKIKPVVTLPGHAIELGHLGYVHPPIPLLHGMAH